ncbi:hypothetical protein DRO69_02485 [Candidatus Bathyarchaeota archaeon]|nr:MAG: hypothetical protein DRO69_02485 [Candidatus Bathyarchaeota archaeon]
MKVLSRKPLVFILSQKELLEDNPALNLSPEYHALKHGLLKEVLECKLCGELLPDRSVKRFMKHLLSKHQSEFVDKCERLFFKKKLIPTE